MDNILRIFIVLMGTIFTITVFYLLVKKKIDEHNSLLWLVGSILVFALSIAPSSITRLSEILGVEYPPTLLFLLAILLLLFISLYHSVQISTLNRIVRELIQHIALQDYIVQEKKTCVNMNTVLESDIDLSLTSNKST